MEENRKHNQDYAGLYQVYLVTNLINGKIYVGRTMARLERRLKKHIAKAIRNQKQGKRLTHLDRAVLKYGGENFKIELIQLCKSFEEMQDVEGQNIRDRDSMNNKIGYNMVENSSDGVEFTSDVTRERLRDINYGVKTKRASSKFRGVFKRKNKDTWCCYIKCLGHSYNHVAESELAAAELHDKLILFYRKEKAVLNFPEKREEYLKEDLEKLFKEFTTKEVKQGQYKNVGARNNYGRYHAVIKDFDNNFITIGSFKDEKEAAITRDKINYFIRGDIDLNFPELAQESWMQEGEGLYNKIKNRLKPLNSNTFSKYRGVTRTAYKTWKGQARPNGKRFERQFPDQIHAARFYDLMCIFELGRKAKTNFPIDDYPVILTE